MIKKSEAATEGLILQISQENNVLEYLFNKVANLEACNFIKKSFQHGVFL